MTREKYVSFEDVLDALLLEESEPSYTALLNWSARYPEHGEALAEFFANWAVQAQLTQDSTVDEERLANIGVSHALDILHRRATTSENRPVVSRPGRMLAAAARAAGVSDEQLAARIELDLGIISKLNLCRLTSIPRICFERIATVLNTAADRIQEMTTGPPIITAGIQHKSIRKPTPVTEDFAEAIRNSSLSARSKKFWLEAVVAERKTGGV